MTDWKNLADLRQRIIDKQDRRLDERDQTIQELTASVIQLENDYDAIEAELRAQHEAAQPERTPAKVLVLR